MADKPEKKIDPFDVAALEKSLNDSATRVSTIWVSFLIFSLYLLTAATTVTHRQLFLAEPLKLPVLNIDLPLWGFFFLTPILFVIFHAYVLIQVILLARTAAAYNESVDYSIKIDADNARVRQRLANTLFAQVFAGSPREREGSLGSFLRAMAWITLAIAPILILLTFQFMFLPYHSHLATWSHRLLILAELAVAFLLWPLVLNAQQDFRWPNLRLWFTETALNLIGLLRHSERRMQAWTGFRQQSTPLAAAVFFIFTSLSLATFPGEPHLNLTTGNSWLSVNCDRWLAQSFDRLSLPRIDVVDDDKLAKIALYTTVQKLPAFQGERTQNFRDRDLNCIDLSYADLRRTDLSGAYLIGASLRGATLEGASLEKARMNRSLLYSANFQGALLDNALVEEAELTDANFAGASLNGTQLQSITAINTSFKGAFLVGARLQGALLVGAQAQGAVLIGTQLQGAFILSSKLQGATLISAQLQGSDLSYTDFRGVSLNRAQLQAASLKNSDLRGATFEDTQLQGVSLENTNLENAIFSNVYVWRAMGLRCSAIRLRTHIAKATIANNDRQIGEELLMGTLIAIVPLHENTREAILSRANRWDDRNNSSQELKEAFIDKVVSTILKSSRRDEVREKMLSRLTTSQTTTDALEVDWDACEKALAENEKVSPDKFDNEYAKFLSKLVCNERDDPQVIAFGVIRNSMTVENEERRKRSTLLARELLSEHCLTARYFDDTLKGRLRTISGAADGQSGPAGATVPSGSL